MPTPDPALAVVTALAANPFPEIQLALELSAQTGAQEVPEGVAGGPQPDAPVPEGLPRLKLSDAWDVQVTRVVVERLPTASDSEGEE